MTERYPEPEVLQLVLPSNEVLNQLAESVAPSEVESAELQALLDGMLDLARGEQDNPDKRSMVGLAAPQLGINKRIIVIGIDADGMGFVSDFKVYLNPQISLRSTETNANREGCYSTGQVCGIVERADSATITALDRFGNSIAETYDGFLARVFQHEIDHLNGVRFPDRITKADDLLWVKLEEFDDYRDHWQDWPNKCSRDKWEAIKRGEA